MDCDWDFQLKNPGLASSELTNGLARTGQRALLYATGMDEEDMKKPFVAVINSFSEMVPGHMHMRELAEQVKYGILEGGGIAVLCGSLAPDGAVVKQSGVKPSMYRFSGRARVFNSMEEADTAVSAGTIEKGTVLVIRYEGPKGGPGMREMLSTTALIMGRGMDEDCALVTDGRFSGATHGPCIGHISPEAAAGGPIALVEDGDEIFIDIAARRLELKVSPEELERRRAVWKPLVKPRGPALAKYAAHVSSADRGAIIELENSACQ